MKNMSEQNNEWSKSQNRGRIYGGIFLLIVGTLFLMKEIGVDIPRWVFSWQFLLIGIGLYSGLKHNFRKPGWFIMILIGIVFLVKRLIPGLINFHLFWPIVLIIIGVLLILRSNRNKNEWYGDPRQFQFGNPFTTETIVEEGAMEMNAIFGGIKKNVINKSFKGGEVNAIFGGCDLDLSQCDFDKKVSLEINAVFGGCKLSIPSHWKVEPDITAIMGGLNDKRPKFTESYGGEEKTLVIKGTAIFGGIDLI